MERNGRIYFTITGTCYNHGHEFLEKDMQVCLIKEPDNEYDKEAIRVEVEGLGKIGFVANSPRTVIGESYSAGRIYDKIRETDYGRVLFTLPDGVLCFLEEDTILPRKEKNRRNGKE